MNNFETPHIMNKPKTVGEAIHNQIDNFFNMHTLSDIKDTFLQMYDAVCAINNTTEIEKDNIRFCIHNQLELLYALESIADPFA